MIKLHELTQKTRLPKADYTQEKLDEFTRLRNVLTPRIEGRLHVVLVGLTLSEIRELIDSAVPDWIDVDCFVSGKRIEAISLEHPEVLPQHTSFKEQVLGVIANLGVLIDPKALKKLMSAYWNNISDFTDACNLLMSKVEDTISTSDVDKYINYQKPVYASEVIQAFLMHDRRRWKLLSTLIVELGDSYAYNAMYKFVKTLLIDKQTYLSGGDNKLRLCEKADGFSISYLYALFATSTNYKQLYGIMYSMDNRDASCLERNIDDYL